MASPKEVEEERVVLMFPGKSLPFDPESLYSLSTDHQWIWGNPQALQKRLGWFPLANFLTQYSAICNVDVATRPVSPEQERWCIV